MGISNYTEGNPIRSGSRLMVFKELQPIDVLSADIIWVRNGDDRLCFFVGDQCLTISYPKMDNEAIATLIPYNKSETSQEWDNFTFSRETVFRRNNLCLMYYEGKSHPSTLPSESPVGADECAQNAGPQKWTPEGVSRVLDDATMGSSHQTPV